MKRLNFSKSEQAVLESMIYGGPAFRKRISVARVRKAIESLKAKQWIFKEEGQPILKFTDKAWENMAEIKALFI